MLFFQAYKEYESQMNDDNPARLYFRQMQVRKFAIPKYIETYNAP